jgi:hypothetical protein
VGIEKKPFDSIAIKIHIILSHAVATARRICSVLSNSESAALIIQLYSGDVHVDSSVQRAAQNAVHVQEAKTCPRLFDEVKVSGGGVAWRKKKKVVTEYCWPVVVRISRTKTKGEYYKSVHAVRNTPAHVMVGLYLGEVVETGLVSDGRWCAAIPGYRNSKSLDSKITRNWPWERYLALKAVGGFFNSSRKMPNSVTRNIKDANCKLRWFCRYDDGRNITRGRVCAALFTKRPVRRGMELLWDYNWLP